MFRKIRNSLIARITAISIVTVALTIVFSGTAVLGAYEASLRRIVDNHITAYTDILLANIKLHGGEVILENGAAIARIPRYWQISAKGRNYYKSDRLKKWIALRPESLSESQHFDATDSDGVKIEAVQASYMFPGDERLTLIFGLDQNICEAYFAQERRHLESPLLRILIAEGILLIALSYFVTRYLTAPINAVSNALHDIRQGKEERVQGSYPDEINELTAEINHLLDYTSGLVARHREFSGNLAHSLKTPLTVLRNETDICTIRKKADAMLNVIERSLARVHAAPSSTLLSVSTSILPVLRDIGDGFGKVYGKAVEVDYPEEYRFRGDKADLYELLGNIIENACKFAKSKVKVSNEDGAIVIEDDGGGIPAAQRNEVLERGARLDSSKPGSGIGLAIARDIIGLHKGSISLDSSALSGLKVIINLPLQR